MLVPEELSSDIFGHQHYLIFETENFNSVSYKIRVLNEKEQIRFYADRVIGGNCYHRHFGRGRPPLYKGYTIMAKLSEARTPCPLLQVALQHIIAIKTPGLIVLR